MPYQFTPSNADTLVELKNYVERSLRELSSDRDSATLIVPKYYRQPKSIDSTLFYVPAEATWNPGGGAGLYYYNGTSFLQIQVV